jgi:crossover junction endodeoxyribonuclease RusA
MMLQLPYPPSTNRVWRTANGRTYRDPRANAYAKEVWSIAKARGMKPITGPVRIIVQLFPQAPKRDVGRPTRCIDLDNALKVVLDSLNGLAWQDDAQVTTIIARKMSPIQQAQVCVEVMSEI